jgi:hypothetical protein
MSRRLQENLIAIAFLFVFLGVIALSLEFGPRARMIPLPLATFGAMLALIQLVWQNLGSTDALKMDMFRIERPAEVSAAGGTDDESLHVAAAPQRSAAAAHGIVLGLLLLILAAGPLIAVFVFTAAYFVMTRYCAPVASLLYAAGVTAAIHVLFFVALQIQPYYGLLAPVVAYFE